MWIFIKSGRLLCLNLSLLTLGASASSPEEGKRHFEKYRKWLFSLGEVVISPANPLKNTHTLLPDGSVSQGSSVAMSGYTIVQAPDIEKALEMTKACPFLDVGGTLEVSELVEMNM